MKKKKLNELLVKFEELTRTSTDKKKIKKLFGEICEEAIGKDTIQQKAWIILQKHNLKLFNEMSKEMCSHTTK